MLNNNFLSKIKQVAADLPPDLSTHAERDLRLLDRAGINSFDLLVSALQDQRTHRDVRIAACWVLGRLCNKRDVNILLNAFNDPDSHLSWEAAKSLAMLKSKRALRPLIAALREAADTNKRQAAAYALGWLCDQRAVEALIGTLNNRREDAGVRGQAAESLGNLGDKRAVGPLIAVLKDASTEVRFWSAFALGQLQDRRALPELTRLANIDRAILDGWWEVGREASDAIARIRGDEKS